MVSTTGHYIGTSKSNWAKTLVQALALPFKLLASFLVWFCPMPLELSRRTLGPSLEDRSCWGLFLRKAVVCGHELHGAS